MSKVFNVSFLHAKTKNQIRDGLMYRKKKLKKNQGMLFHTGLKVSSFWMKNTFIPLDVLFLNKSGKILGYKENNKPHSLKGISIGKKSFADDKLIKNYNSIIETLEKEKSNNTIKGELVKSAFVTSTMGVSYKLKIGKSI